jgi:hypothetical protein
MSFISDYDSERNSFDFNMQSRFEKLNIDESKLLIDQQSTRRSKRLKRPQIVATNSCGKQSNIKMKQNKSDQKFMHQPSSIKCSRQLDMNMKNVKVDNQDNFADIEEPDLEGLDASKSALARSRENRKKNDDSNRVSNVLKKLNHMIRNENLIAIDQICQADSDEDSDDFLYFN